MGIAEIMASHRRAATAACAGLVAALAIGAAALAGATDVDRTVVLERDDGAQSRTEQPRESPEDTADSMLPEDVRALRGSYGASELAVQSALSANVWTCSLPGISLTFSEDGRTWTENDNGDAAVTAYAITAVADAQVSESAGTVTTTTAFTVQTPAGTSMATLATQSYSDGSASVTTLKCAAFKSSPSWTLAERAKSLEVEGPDDEWFATYGTTPEALSRAFDDFVGTAWPTVSKATWDGTMGFDYAAGVARLPFTLDDARRTKVSAVLTLSDGSFAVGVS